MINQAGSSAETADDQARYPRVRETLALQIDLEILDNPELALHKLVDLPDLFGLLDEPLDLPVLEVIHETLFKRSGRVGKPRGEHTAWPLEDPGTLNRVGFFVEWRYFTLTDVGDGALESGLGGDLVFQREEKAVLARTKEGRDHVDRLVEVLDGLGCKYAVHVLERLG